ncbi:AdoMet-homocysteine methyltransferase [Aspergillus alliaceus]|uniref:AdoMet-homocysteine methyltransferase n=1 Tax=Petromyces alliaceus TaxID=209559 RepID=A0A5N6G2X6_PETAA|nr:Homocysteine S-methyltransferase [Aspergillus alliaceus]KAB8236612.1 Homocysteine S-methyltransferase [Aspergillus alliaceus]KAE8395543.1 Homocysteine S-methyltransferase [Aspergillus alliaceus]KAF5865093.1 AdoMet-homocysteine methyltransferase [Aspergillus burnettii]
MSTRTRPILLLDGGLGTTLGEPPHNITFTAETPLWSAHLLISSPHTLQEVHQAFATAGADIVLTATYQTSFEGFMRTNPRYTAEDAAHYMRSAIPLAQRAHASPGKTVKVALSLGPYGATMSPIAAEYTGLYPAEMDSEPRLREWHAQRLCVFVDETGTWDKVEYIAFETVRRADEVRAIRGAMLDVLADMYEGQGPGVGRRQSAVGRKKPWWICGVFPSEEVDEKDVRAWIRAAVGTQETTPGVYLPRPWGIGVNCTRIGNVGRIVSIMQDELRNLSALGTKGYVDEWDGVTGRPWLVLYPDGTHGEKYDPVTKTWVETETGRETRPWDEIFWDVVQGLPDGAWEGVIMGGCCRAGPEQIAALRRRVDSDKQSQR